MDFPKNITIPTNKIWAVYAYGSKVYKSDTIHSDTDYIVIAEVPEKLEFHGKEDVQVYPIGEFQKSLNNHEIWALECLFLPEELKLEKSIFYTFTLNLTTLRESLSQKSSHSWVKAKKKIEVEKDFLIGQKSLFHSFRILNYGLQIAKEGKITDFGVCNHLLNEIKTLPADWTILKDKYQVSYNNLKSEFRKACPIKND